MPPGEVGAFAKSFPHIRASKARAALADLPELRNSGFGRMAARGELDSFLSLVEGLDGLPRHVALHPCGVLLSDATLLDRTPVERSAAGFPMSQFDKDDVERLGLLKLDVLGVRMQSAMAHAIAETERVTGEVIELDSEGLDDPATFELIRTTRTLGCFQIESPGQRELIGKFAPETFGDLITDISLFRPGPVKSDMITPFLRARQGWCEPQYLHDDLRPALEETYGVVVFHEQVLRILAVFTDCSLAEADEIRRSMGSIEGLDDVRAWFYPAALRRGYRLTIVEQVWEVLRAFASFGFCKAHAAAFALPTYQSAWLKTHYPAAFYAGLLTHDPGMYPKRLILDDARHFGVVIHGLDVNESDDVYRLVVDDEGKQGVRLPLSDVKGISDDEVERVINGRPYSSLADLWHRARISRPVAENLVVAGAFDSLYRFGGTQRRGALTRRDLLLQVADLERMGAGVSTSQLTFDLVDDLATLTPSGLPEMSAADRVRAEIDVLGMDVSHHVMDFYSDLLQSIGATHAESLLNCRSQQQVLIAGVKVSVQTPPVRSGRRVIFVTLDDSTGPVDATFFDDAQGDFAGTVFGSWVMLIRGFVRRTGPRGVSVRATGCWELGQVREVWRAGGAAAVWQMIDSDQPEPDTSRRRVLVHSSGYRQSPYADVRPAGGDVRKPSSALWHRSPGASE
jgi:error-prone DNA polymerase